MKNIFQNKPLQRRKLCFGEKPSLFFSALFLLAALAVFSGCDLLVNKPEIYVKIDEMRYTNISGGEIGMYQPTKTYPLTGQEMESTRKKDVIEFDFENSGKTAYFAVQIENEGKKGPWGPLASALIP